MEWKIGGINNDNGVKRGWIRNKSGARKMNGKCMGWVRGRKNGESEVGKKEG